MARISHISVAIPMMDEADNLPALLHMLRGQTYRHFTVYCCVNQPEPLSAPNPQQVLQVREGNRRTLEALAAVHDLPLVVIDRSSPGRGWQPKQQGVGWARKVLMDSIAAHCAAEELIVSLDADTAFDPEYLECVCHAMNSHPHAEALCVPYYHPLSGHAAWDAAMLRYELYMRHYLLSLLRIESPYAFTALGSAMAFTARAYKKVGGISPLQGGEDFYLMQKFVKVCGSEAVLRRLDRCVYPQGRPSQRVPFGTGPAIAKGQAAMVEAYPFYHFALYRQVADTFALFPTLYTEEVETPMTPFLRRQLRTHEVWAPLRANFKSPAQFVHACMERVDGLRIRQYLRQSAGTETEQETFFSLWQGRPCPVPQDFLPSTADVDALNSVRDILFREEMERR